MAVLRRRDAEVAFGTLRWFPRFEGQVDAPLAGPEYSWRADRAADWVDRHRRGPRLSKALDTLATQIGSDDYKDFELGVESLGEILGFESVRPNATADPDCAWREGEETWLLWEAKTMEHPKAPLAARDARQASTHHNWVARQLGWPEPRRSATIVVCPRGEVHPDAVAVADQRLFLIGLEPVRLRSPGAQRRRSMSRPTRRPLSIGRISSAASASSSSSNALGRTSCSSS